MARCRLSRCLQPWLWDIAFASLRLWYLLWGPRPVVGNQQRGGRCSDAACGAGDFCPILSEADSSDCTRPVLEQRRG